MAGYRDIGSSGRRRGVVEATAAVCKLSVMTVGRGRKVSGVAPRSGDGWDAGGSPVELKLLVGFSPIGESTKQYLPGHSNISGPEGWQFLCADPAAYHPALPISPPRLASAAASAAH